MSFIKEEWTRMYRLFQPHNTFIAWKYRLETNIELKPQAWKVKFTSRGCQQVVAIMTRANVIKIKIKCILSTDFMIDCVEAHVSTQLRWFSYRMQWWSYKWSHLLWLHITNLACRQQIYWKGEKNWAIHHQFMENFRENCCK